MNYKDLTREVFIESGRRMNDLGFQTLAAMQDTSEDAIQKALNNAFWIDEDARKILAAWLEAAKSGRDGIRNRIDENFRVINDMLEKV